MKEISRNLRQLLLEGDLLAIAAGLLLGLAAYYFVQSLVEGLIGPVIAAVFNEAGLYALSFRAGNGEVGYGYVLSALIVLVLALVAVALLGKLREGLGNPSSET